MDDSTLWMVEVGAGVLGVFSLVLGAWLWENFGSRLFGDRGDDR